MNKDNVLQFEGRETITTDALTQLLKSGAQQMLQVAIEAEAQDFMLQFQGRLLDDGRAAVVRNGHQPERDLQTGIRPVDSQSTQGSLTRRRTCDIPLSACAAVCS